MIGHSIYPHTTKTVSTGDFDVRIRSDWCVANCKGEWVKFVGDWNWYPDNGGHLRFIRWEFEEEYDLLKFLLRWG